MGLLTDEEKRNIWVCGDGTLEAICKAQDTKTRTKLREVVEGAGLTDKEIWELVGELKTTYEEDLKLVAQAQHQAILKAIDGGNNETANTSTD